LLVHFLLRPCPKDGTTYCAQNFSSFVINYHNQIFVFFPPPRNLLLFIFSLQTCRVALFSQNPGGEDGTGGLLILLFFSIYVGREDREGWEKLLVLKI
jgi:hypothetical protein